MTIELLSTEEYNRLMEIQRDHPKLTFQNIGYQYMDRDTLSEKDKEADEEVKAILNKHIRDFRKFDNFRLSTRKDTKEQELQARFQYVWDPASTGFTGVGYITLRELLNGFDEPDPEPVKE